MSCSVFRGPSSSFCSTSCGFDPTPNLANRWWYWRQGRSAFGNFLHRRCCSPPLRPPPLPHQTIASNLASTRASFRQHSSRFICFLLQRLPKLFLEVLHPIATKVKNTILHSNRKFLHRHELDWYYSPYRDEFSGLERLYLLEFCLKYAPPCRIELL